MGINEIKKYLSTFNLDHRVIEFDESTATVELAAFQLHIDQSLIAKSIGLYSLTGVLLIVTSGDMKIDNRKFINRFGLKAKMINRDDTFDLIGHQCGGVCPFLLNSGVEVYFDNSLKRFDCVYPAAGSSNSVVKLTISELEMLAKPINWVDVCKSKEQ